MTAALRLRSKYKVGRAHDGSIVVLSLDIHCWTGHVPEVARSTAWNAVAHRQGRIRGQAARTIQEKLQMIREAFEKT